MKDKPAIPIEPETNQLFCGRCGKPAIRGKNIGDHCGQFFDIEKNGMFCSGTIVEPDDWPVQCSLDEQQCREECEYKNKKNREGCPFSSKLPYKKEFEEYFKKYYSHLVKPDTSLQPKDEMKEWILEVMNRGIIIPSDSLYQKAIINFVNVKNGIYVWK